jgi:hypothetical protein
MAHARACIAHTPRVPGSAADLASFAFAAAGVAIAVAALVSLVRTLQIYRGAPLRRLTELSEADARLGPSVEHAAVDLERLGFRRIAVLGLLLPGKREPVAERVLLSDDGTTSAEIVAPTKKAFVSLTSRLADGFIVETHFPEYVRLVRPIVDLSGTQESLVAALADHRRRVAEHRARHGEPGRQATVADILALDAEYRTTVAPAVLWIPTRRAIVVNVLGVAIGLVLAVPPIAALLWPPPGG